MDLKHKNLNAILMMVSMNRGAICMDMGPWYRSTQDMMLRSGVPVGRRESYIAVFHTRTQDPH